MKYGLVNSNCYCSCLTSRIALDFGTLLANRSQLEQFSGIVPEGHHLPVAMFMNFYMTFKTLKFLSKKLLGTNATNTYLIPF